MTAIHRARGSVSVGATAFFIPFHWHPATLAILIRLVHDQPIESARTLSVETIKRCLPRRLACRAVDSKAGLPRRRFSEASHVVALAKIGSFPKAGSDNRAACSSALDLSIRLAQAQKDDNRSTRIR